MGDIFRGARPRAPTPPPEPRRVTEEDVDKARRRRQRRLDDRVDRSSLIFGLQIPSPTTTANPGLQIPGGGS